MSPEQLANLRLHVFKLSVLLYYQDAYLRPLLQRAPTLKAA